MTWRVSVVFTKTLISANIQSKIDHPGNDARIVLELNKFSKKATSYRNRTLTLGHVFTCIYLDVLPTANSDCLNDRDFNDLYTVMLIILYTVLCKSHKHQCWQCWKTAFNALYALIFVSTLSTNKHSIQNYCTKSFLAGISLKYCLLVPVKIR